VRVVKDTRTDEARIAEEVRKERIRVATPGGEQRGCGPNIPALGGRHADLATRRAG
jgi:hypothetical protein